MDKKTITVVVPTYNEQENIPLVYERIGNLFREKPPNYDWEILYIDNYSNDASREKIEELSKADRRVKSIFNARNYGFTRSTYYGLSQATGDCAVLMFADMQDPPEVIPQFVEQWEQGKKVVVGRKKHSKENPVLSLIRKIYYSLLKKICEIEHIENYNGFGLYDRSFIEIMRKLDDPLPYFRGIVAELGAKRGEVLYEHDLRKYGKSKFNFMRLYDVAMLGITSYSKVLMRLSTLIGVAAGGISALAIVVTAIYKLINWDTFAVGRPLLIALGFLFGSIQMFFLGLMSEYVMSINARTMRHPLVIEEKRINFDEKQEKV